jgi:hypothetical protein
MVPFPCAAGVEGRGHQQSAGRGVAQAVDQPARPPAALLDPIYGQGWRNRCPDAFAVAGLAARRLYAIQRGEIALKFGETIGSRAAAGQVPLDGRSFFALTVDLFHHLFIRQMLHVATRKGASRRRNF